MKKIGMSFLIAILCFSNTIQAFEIQKIPLVEQVMTSDSDVFLLIENLWLKTEGFQISCAGAFVLVNGGWITLAEAVEVGDFQASWQCSRCKRYNMDGIKACPYCGKSKNA